MIRLWNLFSFHTHSYMACSCCSHHGHSSGIDSTLCIADDLFITFSFVWIFFLCITWRDSTNLIRLFVSVIGVYSVFFFLITSILIVHVRTIFRDIHVSAKFTPSNWTVDVCLYSSGVLKDLEWCQCYLYSIKCYHKNAWNLSQIFKKNLLNCHQKW